MQTTANRTVANSLPKNEVILLTLLISKRYIPYTDLRKISGISAELQQIKNKSTVFLSLPNNTTSAVLHMDTHRTFMPQSD